MQEYYEILGVSADATDQEIENAYFTLKSKYSRDRFLEGEAGNEAAKNLTKLETAYNEIIEYRKSFKQSESGVKSDYSGVESYIKEGKMADAQKMLDDISERDAEWHYLQSVIFYKKNWVSESKKQLEIAMSMEPHNEKYSDSYTKLKQKIEYNERQFHSGNAGFTGDERQNRQMGGDGLSDCFTWCATWCCMDMLCSMCCR